MNRGPNACMEIAIHMLLYLNDSTSNFIPACFFSLSRFGSTRWWTLPFTAVTTVSRLFSSTVLVSQFLFLFFWLLKYRSCDGVESECILKFAIFNWKFKNLSNSISEQWTRNSQRKQCVDDIINSFVSNSTHFNAHERNLWRLIQLNRRNFFSLVLFVRNCFKLTMCKFGARFCVSRIHCAIQVSVWCAWKPVLSSVFSTHVWTYFSFIHIQIS